VYNAEGRSNSWFCIAEKSRRLCGGVEWHRVKYNTAARSCAA
jgi:hypothetical protein